MLPKGTFLPVPLLCDVNIGEAVRLHEGESKEAFLKRSRDALLSLAPPEKQQAFKQEEDAA